MAARTVVLVVDDEALTRDVVVAMLESEDVVVHTASSGDEALVRAADVHPHVVLLDLMMPGRGGLAVCREMRGNPATRDARIVVLSGRADEQTRVAATAAGADQFLTKPYSARDLFAAIHGPAPHAS